MGTFVSAADAIELGLLGNDDYLQRDKGRLLKWAKYVYQDMNMTTLKVAKRQFVKIDKRTNSINIPKNEWFSSVDVADRNGCLYPVYRNQNVKNNDIVEIAAAENCACEYKCGFKLCNTIKGYEAIVSVKTDKNPDGSDVSFNCVDRKGVDDNGFFYSQQQYPERIYTDGVWTSTILHTENTKLCKVEVDQNGCVCDTEENADLLCNACGISTVDQTHCVIGGTSLTPPIPNVDTWIYYCNSKLDWFSSQCGHHAGHHSYCNNYYNLSELGDRVIFPHNFGHDEVLLRTYVDLGVKDILIPMIAVDVFIIGLKWWDCRFNDNKQKMAQLYSIEYSKLKWGLLAELNKHRLSEYAMMLMPKTFVPSYIDHRQDYLSAGTINF